MKKIISILLIALLSFSSGYATISESTSINTDDLLKTNIFYINWQWYIKDNGKLKKVDGIDFYSIAGERFIKKDWKVVKINENKIFKINNINYVKQNWKLMTLEKYLQLNPVSDIKGWTFSDIYKKELNKEIKLTLLSKTKIENLKVKTIEELENMILEKYPETTWTLKLIKTKNTNTQFLADLKDYYFEKWDKEIAKKVYILENISKLDIDKINKAIRAKLNKENIKFIDSYSEDSEIDNYIEGLMWDYDIKDPEVTNENEDDDLEDIFGNIFEDINEDDIEFNSAEENINENTNNEEENSDIDWDDFEDEDLDDL